MQLVIKMFEVKRHSLIVLFLWCLRFLKPGISLLNKDLNCSFESEPDIRSSWYNKPVNTIWQRAALSWVNVGVGLYICKYIPILESLSIRWGLKLSLFCCVFEVINAVMKMEINYCEVIVHMLRYELNITVDLNWGLNDKTGLWTIHDRGQHWYPIN